MKLIKDCFTGKDNKTYDVGRILAVMSVCLYWFVVIKTGASNMMDIGTGLGAIIGGSLVGIGFKRKAEP